MAEPIKLYLDEDTISRALIQALRARGVDVLTAQEANKLAVTDRDQLEFAISLDRAIFSYNTRDYAVLHTEYMAAEREHAGIIVSNQLYVGLVIRRLLKLIDEKSASEIHSRLEFLSNWR